jgi:uncharacterized protein
MYPEVSDSVQWFAESGRAVFVIMKMYFMDPASGGGMATIVHFDVPAEDPERAKKFYASLFDFKYQLVPEFQYNLITTTNLDGTPGVGGGLGKRMDPSQHMTNYFGVKSIDAAMKQVTKLGGKLVSPKMPVPGMGWLVNCMDTEGNAFGLWEENTGVK